MFIAGSVCTTRNPTCNPTNYNGCTYGCANGCTDSDGNHGSTNSRCNKCNPRPGYYDSKTNGDIDTADRGHHQDDQL